MKKLISIICLTFLFVCGYGQFRFTSFGWADDVLDLYYTTYQANNWQTQINCSTHTFYFNYTIREYNTQVQYNGTLSYIDTCFLVFPKHWRYYGSDCGGWYGVSAPPYTHTQRQVINGAYESVVTEYPKPKGDLHIPYYNVLITNSVPKYREVVGIGERTFYGCDSLTKITIPSTVRRIEELFIYGCSMLDTVVFENTFNEDTVYPPRMQDYTWFIETPLTIVVPCNSYDTFYNYIHSLATPQMVQLNIVPDNICDCGAYVIDTVQVYDTTQVVETVYDTVAVYDTTQVVDTIHTTEVVYDTVQVAETVYDTVNIYDTITTNIVNVHHVYDTTFVHDTITYTQYFMYYDTTSVTVYDTIPVQVYDTTVVLVNDTNTVSVYDTITETITYIYEVYDTNYVTIYDTLVINVYDTIYTTIYDTVFVFKQINETFDDLRLYPIPTRDYVNVDYTGGHLEYQLFNNRGKYLESGEVTLHNTVDMTKYATGEYYFRARLDNGEIITKKIVKVSM